MFSPARIRPANFHWNVSLMALIKRHISHSDDSLKDEPMPLSYSVFEHNSDVTKPPLVVLHETFGTKRNWDRMCRKMVKKIVPKRRIISVDARNHGDSPYSAYHTQELLVVDLKRFFIQRGIRQAVLMGHSMGGKTTMILSLTHPEMVEKFIVADICPKTYPDLEDKGYILTALNQLRIPSGIPLARAILIAEQQLEAYIDDQDLRKFLLINLNQNESGDYVIKINVKSLYENFKNLQSFPDMKRRVFDKPCLFIGGTLSEYLTQNDHNVIKKFFPKAKFEYIKDAGHWLHFDKPEEYFQLCLNFLNSTS